MQQNTIPQYGLYLIYMIFFSILTYIQLQHPKLNHDILRYGAVALEYDGYSPEEAHQEIYSRLEKELGTEKFKQLTEFNAKAKEYKEHPNSFIESMDFFRVKPLYTASVYLFHKSAWPIGNATYLISFLFYLATIYYLMENLLKFGVSNMNASLTACVMSISTPMLAISNLSSPDSMSVFFLMLGFYAILQKKNSWHIAGILLLACLTRPDNAIFASVYFFWIAIKEWRGISISIKVRKLGLSFAFISLVLIIPFLAGNDMDWIGKFKHMDSRSVYWQEMKNSLVQFIRKSSIPFYFLLGLFAYPLSSKRAKSLIEVLALTFVARSFLFPSFQGRFYVAFALIFFFLFVLGISNMIEKRSIETAIET